MNCAAVVRAEASLIVSDVVFEPPNLKIKTCCRGPPTAREAKVSTSQPTRVVYSRPVHVVGAEEAAFGPI